MKWIEFKKEKPNLGELVIVQREYNDEVTYGYYQSCKEWGFENRFSHERGGNLAFYDVVAFQRLPNKMK